MINIKEVVNCYSIGGFQIAIVIAVTIMIVENIFGCWEEEWRAMHFYSKTFVLFLNTPGYLKGDYIFYLKPLCYGYHIIVAQHFEDQSLNQIVHII